MRAALQSSWLFLFLTLTLHGEAAVKHELVVDDPRPVAKAIQELGDQYGYAITYEDPQYSYAADIRDVTDEVRRSPATDQSRRVLVPAGGSLAVQLEPVPVANASDQAASLATQVLAAAARGGEGGRFRLARSGSFLHVIPTSVRNERGDWIIQDSILDVAISFEPGERRGIDTLNEICAAVTRSTGQRMFLASAPLNLFVNFQDRSGATGAPARQVLTSLLERTGQALAWSIFFDPGARTYALNLRYARAPPTRNPVTVEPNQVQPKKLPPASATNPSGT